MQIPPEINYINQADSSLLLQMTGSWTLDGDIPDTSGPVEKIGFTGVVSFDCKKVTAWDSGLLIFLTPLADYCRENTIKINPAGLPDGVEQLLELAYAVPERKGARRSVGKSSFLHDVGMDVINGVRAIGEFISFFGDCLIAMGKMIRGKAVYQRSELWRIMQETGAQALPIVSLVSLLVGLILAFVGAVELKEFGAGVYMADLVGIAMTREMGAIMTGIIMAGRTGAAFAAELGSMTVNQEIDALQTAGFSTMEFLVLPRMVALMLMMPLLTIYADLMGILGGVLVAVPILDIKASQYFIEVYKAVSIADFLAGIFMASVYGVIVAVVGCLRGITCGRSAQAVGTATTSAVVSAIVMIVVACAVMTVLFNALGL